MKCTVHTTSCYELNKHTRTLTTSLSNTNTLVRQPHHRYQYINSKYTSPFSLIFTYPIIQMYIFCPLTKLFNIDESRPLIVPHEFLQPVEVPILDFIYNTCYNHKLYNLIQNAPYELSPSTEEHNIIKALELLWPLLRTKYIFRWLAKLLTSSDIIHDVFPHRFFTDD